MRTPDHVRSSKAYIKKRSFITAYKAAEGCSHCGENDPIVLDLHHVDPTTKHPSLRTPLRKGMLVLGYEMILEEVTKCIVLCANCHRREEHRLRQS